MSGLVNEQCSACRVGAPTVTETEARELLLEIPDWAIVTVKDVPQLKREYRFKNFAAALAFVNAVGELAESLQHHPDITFGWGYARIVWYTHKIHGLHRNDFVCAAKSDQLFEQNQS